MVMEMEGGQQQDASATDDQVAAVTADLVAAVVAAHEATRPLERHEGTVESAARTVEVYDPTPVIRGYDTGYDTPLSACPEPHVDVPPPACTPGLDAMSVPRASPPQEIIHSTEPPVAIETSAPETTKPNDAVPLSPSDRAETLPTGESAAEDRAVAVPVQPAAVTTSATAPPPLPPVVDLVAAAKVRETWSLMFGSRYDDDDDKDERAEQSPDKVATHSDSQKNAARPHKIVQTNRSSLRTKLERERRLDEEIQGVVRDRPTSRADDPISSSGSPAKASRRRPKPAGWLADDQPFEQAGLLPTTVRFCMEKAMQQTVRCLAELHAIAQDEPTPSRTNLVLGLFVTQWELHHILDELDAASSLPPAATNLQLHNPEYEDLPLTTLLQVSWFLPLDQFTTLRSRVAEISCRRLSDARLARLNAALRRYFVLRPHPGVRLQRLLLRVVETLVPSKTTNQSDGDANDRQQESAVVVTELLHALHVRTPHVEILTIAAFMQLNPSALATQLQLSSVVTLQRIVFFRFFIEALVTQRASQTTGTNAWWPRSTGKPRGSTLERRLSGNAASGTDEPTTPLRSAALKRKKRPKRPPPFDEQEPSMAMQRDEDTDVCSSSEATRGSNLPSPPPQATAQADDRTVDTPDAIDPIAFTKQNEALTTALARLVKAHPWLVDDETTADVSAAATATRASFLAAESFQQSFTLLAASAAPVAPSIVAKMEACTKLLDDLATRVVEPRIDEPADAPPQYDPPELLATEPYKPPPPRVQRTHSGSFPPPYVPTTPAYWTFAPEIPAPATPHSSIPRSVSKAQASPGAGDYDVQRSDRLTFQQRAGHSFGKSGLATVDEADAATLVKSTVKSREGDSIQKSQRRGVVAGSASAASLEPPAYAHWASAAVDHTTSATYRLDDDDDDNDDDAIDVQVRDALRLQQSFVLDDLVQNLLHRGKPVACSQAPLSRPSSATATKRPATSRVVSRVRTIATSRASDDEPAKERPKSKPTSAATTRTKPPPPPPYATHKDQTTLHSPVRQPPRDYEPPVDDAHLQWAARVSERYKAQLQAATRNVAG